MTTHHRAGGWLPRSRQRIDRWNIDLKQRLGEDPKPLAAPIQALEDIFVCDPADPYYGFTSWDDFFTRRFVDGVRPVAAGKDEVANACESAAPQKVEKATETAKFWLKDQPYSLQDMMGFDPLAARFAGGTVYQAFLSALSYHRWNSPVTGVVRKAYLDQRLLLPGEPL